jgi:predicted transcriptional regulator
MSEKRSGKKAIRRRGSDLAPMTLVSVRVPTSLVTDLEEIAERRNEPKTALVRMALEDYLNTPKNRRRKAS